MTGSLRYDRAGQAGAPVVFLHGLGADRAQMRALAEATVRGDRRAVMPDLRGHGQTDLSLSPTDLTIPRLADDVECLCSDLGIRRNLVVVGVSMGAAITAELLARQRLEIAAAVLIRPAWRWEPSPSNLAPFPVIGSLLRDHGPVRGRALFARSEKLAAVAATSPGAAQALLKQFETPRAMQLAQRLTSIPRSAPTPPPKATLPPLLIVGSEHDPAHPMSTARALHSDVGGQLLTIAPRYDAPAEHAAQLTAAVTQFLRETDTHAKPW